ncbi:MAG: hypothetical protein BZY87_07495 [SAR202 cluster bacterium Io17-Chloro-G6]|nr:MAG: hypothetical protein BZY87_07495 [SAR202 cluster bacterium Io17-Chloro-G6]
MVTFADSVTRDKLSGLVEGVDEHDSLGEFINSLDFSWNEKEVINESLALLPELSASPDVLPAKAPDMIKGDWWI